MPKIRSIVGHERQIALLSQDIESGNIAHAYLLSGPPHLGKMTVAHWFASEILTRGLAPGEETESARRHIERLTHSDLLVLDQLWIEKLCDDWSVIARSSNVNQLHRSKKSEPAKTDTISIDDIREMQHRLYETSMGTHRCCLIRSVERMQDAAANAFLKILEEPPEGLVFILTTQAQSALLPTITSRTRILHFATLPHATLLPILDGVDDEDAAFILRLAQGAPGIVYRLRDNPDALRLEKQVYDKALSFWDSRSLKNRLQILSPLHTRGEEADRLLTHLALSLRQQNVSIRGRCLSPFMCMMHDLETNAHRQLAAQRFALSVSG